MKKFATIALVAAAFGAVPSAVLADEASNASSVQLEVKKSAMLYDAEGRRLARVYDVRQDGDPQVILNSRLYTIPASTLSVVDEKLTTSLTKKEITSN